MKNLLMLFLFASTIFVTGAEEVYTPKLNGWFTWKASKSRAKFIRTKPNAQYPHGMVRFEAVPGSGKYAASTYGNEKITPDKR